MAADKKGKAEKAPAKDKNKAPKPEAKAKAPKPKKEEAVAAAPVEETKPAAPAAPRPPADPRLKILKKFHGRFLPKGPLRDRLKALLVRWDSGEDHGGVTLEELKSLLNDWRAARQRPTKV